MAQTFYWYKHWVKNKIVKTKISCNKSASENVLAKKMWKIKVKMNKPFYLRLSKLKVSKIRMLQF